MDEEKKSVVGILDVVPNTTLPVVDPDQLIGYSFATEHAGETQRGAVKGKQDDKYHVEYADGNEDHLTYAEIINLLNKKTEDGYHLWTFKEILNHRLTIRLMGSRLWKLKCCGTQGRRPGNL